MATEADMVTIMDMVSKTVTMPLSGAGITGHLLSLRTVRAMTPLGPPSWLRLCHLWPKAILLRPANLFNFRAIDGAIEPVGRPR